MPNMETHVATKKEHRCSECGRRIPIGTRYFSDGGSHREHTNCLEYRHEPIMEDGFNTNRKAGQMKDTCILDIDNFGRLKDPFERFGFNDNENI